MAEQLANLITDNADEMKLLGTITGTETLTIPTGTHHIKISVYIFHPSYPTYADVLSTLTVDTSELDYINKDNIVFRFYWAANNTSDNRIAVIEYKRSTGNLYIGDITIAGTSNKSNGRVFVYID